jgi:hypothetical protein
MIGPDPLARPRNDRRLIYRPPARNIEHRAGRERAILRREPRDHRRELFDVDETVHWNLRQHVVDMLLRHLAEHFGLGRRRRDAIDQHAGRRQFLGQRFRQSDQAGFRRRIMRGVRIAVLAGDGSDVDDAPVARGHHMGHHRAADEVGRDEIDLDDAAPDVGF